MSNERIGKKSRGASPILSGTLLLISLWELNGPFEFKNHILVRLCQENYVHLTLQAMFIFDKKPKKIGLRAIILEMAAKIYLYV